MFKLSTLNDKGNPHPWFLKFEQYVWNNPAHRPHYLDSTTELLNPFLKRYNAHLGRDLDTIYFKNKDGLANFLQQFVKDI